MSNSNNPGDDGSNHHYYQADVNDKYTVNIYPNDRVQSKVPEFKKQSLDDYPFAEAKSDHESNSLLPTEAKHDTHVTTNIPLRMDRLPWSPWHWLVVLALGVSWILDGLEITIVGVLGGVLEEPETLHMTAEQVALLATIYIAGCLVGSLFFGFLSDRIGRKKLFIVTPILYILATGVTAFSVDFYMFAVCQFVKGLGIGGEYSAMNSAINEFIPARVRGFIDLAVNGSYWLGATLGAALSIVLLNPKYIPVNLGWRLPFGIGGVLGISIIVLRMFLPESPRWLVKHGREAEAEEIVSKIEARIAKRKELPPVEGHVAIKLANPSPLLVLRMIFITYWKRSILCFVLMVAQAFFYNSIFFTYALILTTFYPVAPESVGEYLIPFAIGNFFGALLIGRLFDVVGRKPMIFLTYFVSGVLLIGTGLMFTFDILNAITQTVCWSVIFFVASSGASSAYLTISEVFPVEIRAVAISFFYCAGTGGGGLIGPALFGKLVEGKERWHIFYGYCIGAGLMIFASFVELLLGVKAEGKSLEEITEKDE